MLEWIKYQSGNTIEYDKDLGGCMITKNIDYVVDHFRIKSKAYNNYTMNACHFHDAYEIYYLNKGSRQYYINNQTYSIEAGSLVMIPPYILHKTMDTGLAHERLLLSFRPDFLPMTDSTALIQKTFSKRHVLALDATMRNHIETIFNAMIDEASQQDAFFTTRLQLLLTTLLIDVARYIEANESAPKNKNSVKQRIYQVIDYLKTHYKTKISLQQLSDTFFISPYYLSRSFKKTTGVTINKYIQQLRIIEGQRLLKETTRPISSIADELGYANISAFDKQFKSYTGQSPKEYRQSSPKKSIR